MHKGIILLTKASNKDEAKIAIEEFMNEYKNDVWDWYVIGGRWSGILNIKYKRFYELVKEKEIIKTNTYSELEKIEVQEALQDVWRELGEKSLNPYLRDSFLENKFTGKKIFVEYEKGIEVDINKEYADDILPLTECIDIVKEWQQTIEDAKKVEEEAKRWLQIKNEKTGELYDDWRMYGYSLKEAANLYRQEFFFDCNIFNIKKYDYSIPEDIENYFAVMIDIHN
jgi:hypothetical protein